MAHAGYRKVFVTDKGYVGMVPAAAEVGDLVCALLRSNAPLIICPTSGHYVILAETYGSCIYNIVMITN